MPTPAVNHHPVALALHPLNSFDASSIAAWPAPVLVHESPACAHFAKPMGNGPAA